MSIFHRWLTGLANESQRSAQAADSGRSRYRSADGVPRRAGAALPTTGNVPEQFPRGRPLRYRAAHLLPTEPGIYRIRSAAGEEYTGDATNLRRRVREHERNGNFRPQEGEWVDVKLAPAGMQYGARRAVERAKIESYKPRRNKRGGGGGRPPKS